MHMADKIDSVNDLATEEYQGVGPVTAAAATSTMWMLGGHGIGLVAGGLAGWGLGKNETIKNTVQGWWKSIKTTAERWSPTGALEKRFPLIAGGALFGTFLASYVGMAMGAVAGRNNGAIARDQFDRMQAGVRDLQEQNDALKAKADALMEQLKTAQQPTHQVTEVAAHGKHAGHGHEKHDSHLAALTAQEHGAAEVAR